MRISGARLIPSWARIPALCLLLLPAAPLAAAAAPQLPATPTCSQLWNEATKISATDAQAKPSTTAGAPPSAAASAWAKVWTQAWVAAWMGQGSAISGSHAKSCCDRRWFEHAATVGKSAWQKAWQAAPALMAANKTWADAYADAYIEQWAESWFEHFPVFCATAKANAAAKAMATATAKKKIVTDAWADVVEATDTLADAQASTWTQVWAEAGAASWASVGSEAMVLASASAVSEAQGLVVGNCALAKAASCAQAAAAAYESAWAEAGSHAFADAFAAAWANASAIAFASAFGSAFATSDAEAFAYATAKAWSSGSADSYAGTWRVILKDQAQLDKLVHWWKTPGAPMPPIKTINQTLAKANKKAFKSAMKKALKAAYKKDSQWALDFDLAESNALAAATSWSAQWVSAWTESWASAWTATWAHTFALMCSRDAAIACAECPPCTTQTVSLPPRTISRPTGFTYTLAGLGVTAGAIFQIAVHNTTDQPILVEVPAGTVFSPNNPGSQRMVISDDQQVPVQPNQTAQAPLQGYCLDYGKQPPPATTLGASLAEHAEVASLDPGGALAALLAEQNPPGAVRYHVDENPAAYASFLHIIQAGNRLAAEGKLHNDLPPDKYKMAVIQRALWMYASSSAGGPPHTRDTLLADIRRQVQETGGTQTEDQIRELVDHLMEDIDAVLRSANVQ